jgi:hypothetical protein
VNALISEIRGLILFARGAVVHSVDLIQVQTSFEIGRRIVEHEQRGAERAKYGEALLRALSIELTEEFGKGFSARNLRSMRRFFLTRDRLPEIRQMPSAKFQPVRKTQMPSGNFTQAYLPDSAGSWRSGEKWWKGWGRLCWKL